jgi:hypothetical protein
MTEQNWGRRWGIQLAPCILRRLWSYATGKLATPIDQPAIERIVRGQLRLRSLVRRAGQSEIFRWKRR